MNKINIFFAKLKCKKEFKRAVNNMIKIDEKKIDSIHINFLFFVSQIVFFPIFYPNILWIELMRNNMIII